MATVDRYDRFATLTPYHFGADLDRGCGLRHTQVRSLFILNFSSLGGRVCVIRQLLSERR